MLYSSSDSDVPEEEVQRWKQHRAVDSYLHSCNGCGCWGYYGPEPMPDRCRLKYIDLGRYQRKVGFHNITPLTTLTMQSSQNLMLMIVPPHYTAQNISRLPFSHITPYKTMILQKLTLKQGLYWAPKKHQQCRVNVLHCLKELSEKVKELGEKMKGLSKTRANCYRKVRE